MKLQRAARKRSTEILPRLRNLSYTQRLQKLQRWFTGEQEMTEVYKIVHGHYELRSGMCTLHSQVRTITPWPISGSQQEAVQIKLLPGIANTLFHCSCVSKWNSLLYDVGNASSINAFKS